MNKTVFSRIIFLTLVTLGLQSKLSAMELHRPTPIRTGQVSTSETKKGHAILFLGTSSAGKSHISKAAYTYLRKFKDIAPVVRIVMDDEEDRGIDSKTKQSFPGNWRIEHMLLYQSIAQQIEKENIVVCDLVLFENKENDITESFIEKLKTITSVTPVLVYCPINQLLRNVESRNSSGESREHRSPLAIAGNYIDMYFSTLSSPTEATPSHLSELIGDTDESEFKEGEQALAEFKEEDEYQKQEKQEYMERLHQLSSQASSGASSPVPYVKPHLYDMVFKNDGKKFEEKMGTLFFKLYNKLVTTDAPENINC